MDFTVLVTVLLIVVVVPIRNKIIRKFRDKKKQIKGSMNMNGEFIQKQR